MASVVIVGAGPAGISAAAVLLGHGVAPVLIDEADMPGGQVYRRARPGLALDSARLLGPQYEGYRRVHGAFERMADRLDWRPRTLAWGVEPGRLFTVTAGEPADLAYDALILATGAVDRIMPVKGWTLPGVFTLGAAQVLLKSQGCLIGRRTVFAGSSPLLHLAASQFLMMGGEVAGVLDTTPFAHKVAALPDLLAAPRTLAHGLAAMAALRRAGVPIRQGVELNAVEGGREVTGISFRRRGEKADRIACDAVALGHGLKPECQLAELAGAELAFDPTIRQWLPMADGDGRCQRGLYVAGDGARIGGAEAAEVSGRLAAAAVLEDLGLPVAGMDRAADRTHLTRLRRFQRGIAQAFRWPGEAAERLPDEVMVCRCEGIRALELRAIARADFGAREVNRAKALTRCGMGRCQGRYCGLAAAELTAAALGVPLESVGRLRAQAPVKPVSFSAASPATPRRTP